MNLHLNQYYPCSPSFQFRAEENHQAPFEELTDRERQILKLVAQGKTAAEIGSELEISKRTVDSHMSRIHGKTGANLEDEGNPLVKSVLFALRTGLVPLDGSDME